jgi:hypothetical protein
VIGRYISICRYIPLMALTYVLVCVRLVFFISFVYTVVGEMHIFVVQVLHSIAIPEMVETNQ